MCERKSKVTRNPTGTYTFIKLEDWGSTATYSDPFRDGNLYAYILEVQVLPDGLASDLMCYSLGGVFYQDAVEITHLHIRADPFHSLTTGQHLISKGVDVDISPQNVWDRRMALTSEQTVQRLERPPKLSGSGPGGRRNAHQWGKDMFDELGSRMVSLEAIHVTTNLLAEGEPHLRMGQPASGVVVPPADIEMGQGGAALSVIPQAPSMDAGRASIESTATSVIPLAPPMDAGSASVDPAINAMPMPKSNDVPDEPAIGDSACKFGRWRGPAQSRCECGKGTCTFIGGDIDTCHLIVRSVPDVLPVPQKWGGATCEQSANQWGPARRFIPKPKATSTRPVERAVRMNPEHDSVGVQEEPYKRVCRINHAELDRNVLDATFFGTPGDLVCPCGLRRPPDQNQCQCGKMMRARIVPEKTPIAGIRGQSDHVENATQALIMEIVDGYCAEDCKWVVWNCDDSYADSNLQRYQAGFRAIPTDQRTQQRARRNKTAWARTKFIAQPLVRHPKRPETTRGALASATAATAGAITTLEEVNPWQAQLEVAATATRGDNRQVQDYVGTDMETEVPPENDAIEKALQKALARSPQPEGSSSSDAQDPGDQTPTMEFSEAVGGQAAIERSFQPSNIDEVAASADPVDALTAQLNQFIMTESERIKTGATTATREEETADATSQQAKESEDVAAAGSQGPEVATPTGATKAAAATAGAAKPTRSRRDISPPSSGFIAGRTRLASRASAEDDAELPATPLTNLPSPSLPAAAADAELLPAMPTRPVPKAPPSQADIAQYMRDTVPLPAVPVNTEATPEGLAEALRPPDHDDDDSDYADASPESAPVEDDPLERMVPQEQEAMIVDAPAASAGAPDPDRTAAATAASSLEVRRQQQESADAAGPDSSHTDAA
jgi:hypothetical protein